MRYVKSNPQHTEWYVIWSRKDRDVLVSTHSTYEEANKACWPKY